MAGQGNTRDIEFVDGKLIYLPDLSGALPTYQGTICCFDTSLNGGNGGVRPATAQADMAAYVGVAEQNSILNSLGEQLPTVEIGFSNVYMLQSTAAETYKFGTKVYLNEAVAGSFQVTTSTNTGARTVAVGYVVLPNQTMLAGLSSLTGAAGLLIPVAIITNFPVTGGWM